MNYLQEHMKWCVWRYVDTGKKKPDKVPFNPLTKGPASVNQPTTFLRFKEVAPYKNDYDGLAILVQAPLVVVDLDNCIGKKGLKDWAQEIIEHFPKCYIEYSPSGTGLHLFCLMGADFAYDTQTYKMKGKNIEVYVGGHTHRFITVTGQVYQGGVIVEEHSGMRWLLETYLKRERNANQEASDAHSYLSDTSVLQKASHAKNADKFNQLWHGNLSRFGSHSEADLALCAILAFYCGGDATQIDRLFRQSALYRPKWDEQHGVSTYGQMTIDHAVTSLGAVYQPLPKNLEEFNDELTRLKLEFQFPLGAIYSWNDIGSGRLFADFYQEWLRYVPERKSWFVYEDGIWQSDKGHLKAMKACMELANLVHLCALEIKDEDKRKSFQKYASSWQSHSKRVAILQDAQVYHPILMREFDKDPYILNCRNGTYHLKAKEFTEHRSQDLLTKKANVVFDATASHARWQTFVEEIMSHDNEKINFLQRVFGYGLSGDTRHECLFILHGVTTRNGKSTLCEAVLNTLGTYACTARSETLAMRQANSSAPSEDIARLAGVRFVNIAEPQKGLVLNVAQVKTMTGNDSLNARFLHENSFDFKPQFKLYINTNYLPSVNDLTVFKSGRMWLIPFDQHFTASQQDRTLKQLFANEEVKSTILNWLIAGFEQLEKNGLIVPSVIQDATKHYEHDSDKLSLFMEDCLEIGDYEEKTADVYYRYKLWCQENGHFPESMKNFKQVLSSQFTVLRRRPKTGGHKTTVLVGARLIQEFL